MEDHEVDAMADGIFEAMEAEIQPQEEAKQAPRQPMEETKEEVPIKVHSQPQHM